jgi:hypothetical protein
MEQIIVKELLNKYGIDADKKTVSSFVKIIQLGFNATWLKNSCIIKDFDTMYKKGMTNTAIYVELGITYKAHHDSIRRIVANRKDYEL